MHEDRKRILALLADGKITVDEAERMMDAISQAAGMEAPAVKSNAPKYFRVEVDAHEPGDSPSKVNVRVPMQLLRAGVRLSALIPPKAREEVNAAMAREGIPFDINQLKPENLEELIEHLSDFTVDVDNENAKVRVYCE
jgi:hypothetical protein